MKLRSIEVQQNMLKLLKSTIHGVALQHILSKTRSKCVHKSCPNTAMYGDNDYIRLYCGNHAYSKMVNINKLPSLFCIVNGCKNKYDIIYYGLLYCVKHKPVPRSIFVCGAPGCVNEASMSYEDGIAVVMCAKHKSGYCIEPDCTRHANRDYCERHSRPTFLTNKKSNYLKQVAKKQIIVWKPFNYDQIGNSSPM